MVVAGDLPPNPTPQQQQQQQQQRTDVVDDDGSSSAGSSSSTSTSSSSSSCSSTTRQAPPPPPQTHPVDTLAPSVHSVIATPCSCLNLRRRRRNPKESQPTSQPPPLSEHPSSTVSNRFADFSGCGNENSVSSPTSLAAVGVAGVVVQDARSGMLLGGGPNAILTSPVASGAGVRGPVPPPPPPPPPSAPPIQPQASAAATGSSSDHSQHSQRMS
ncbi:unnamed protein product [Hydatigera taeniaeformis]|uniref:Uncharacterized protein n=1 Tax=Hydatigena taeniaeformis TaxID=6205 RepID=A0A0R3WM01_HYDTA|nr:unnamed protein product [Hydatigera taeniaeformis]